jgi:hypothetical protein
MIFGDRQRFGILDVPAEDAVPAKDAVATL